MQIEKIILYGNNKKIRTINLKLGRLNIITGESKSGKSILSDIIEYCFGMDKCNISEGVVRDNVSWYALLLNFGTERLFVARKNPDPGKQSSARCFYINGKDISIPEYDEIVPNTNAKGIEEIVSEKLKISENRHIVPEGQTRAPITATIKHTMYYCIQSQDEIAAKSFLFHRQGEPFIPQAIKDTLPFFLGAANEKSLLIEKELTRAKKKLAELKRKKREAKLLAGAGLGKAISLIGEAQAVGLLDKICFDDLDVEKALKLLGSLQAKESEIPQAGGTRLAEVQKQLKEHQNELEEINSKIRDTEEYLAIFNGYGEEIDSQKARLESIGLFEKLDFNSQRCPFCSGELSKSIPNIENMKQSILDLNESIGEVEKGKPKLKEYLNELKEAKDLVKKKIKEDKNYIDVIYEQENEAKRIKELNFRIGKVIGRISMWCESVKNDNNTDDNEIEKLEKKIKELDSEISLELVVERTTSALSKIQMDMTEWATNTLHLEHGSYPYRLDLNKLTVVVDKDRAIPLRQMGSGSNWVGVHLITFLALHKYFIQNKRPVPRFLFIDQPSQVYFPSSVNKDENDVDMDAVEKIYSFIAKFVKEMNREMQIIIVDHAQLNQDDFRKNIIENWRDGKKLVPEDWCKK